MLFEKGGMLMFREQLEEKANRRIPSRKKNAQEKGVLQKAEMGLSNKLCITCRLFDRPFFV